jgi:pimeloyl-ACP methyl ester carboxylesterase
VHYADYGGDGPPLLLIHGLAGSSLNWMAVAPKLAERHRVYALDLIGFGQTPLAGRRASLSSNRQLIDRFISHVVGEPATLVGNSMGGLLSIQEAASEPGRVRGLVLVDPAVPKPSGAAAMEEAFVQGLFLALIAPGVAEVAAVTRGRIVEPEVVVARVLGLVARNPETIGREIIEAHLAQARLRHGVWEAERAFLQASRSLVAAYAARRRLYALVAKVVAPTLVVHGAHDRLVPLAAARALVKRRPDWQFHVFEELGHVPMMEDPAAFLAVVQDWLHRQQTESAA